MPRVRGDEARSGPAPSAQGASGDPENTGRREGAASWEPRASSQSGRKKNYQRYPKPPYSYLAMIAMVIQRSPEKKLTLSEILKEISKLFPFFEGNYKGWRDSVRHNLSSYDCFVKVLKDPEKPQGKGNFWVVDVSKVPPELLKRQNTAVSRQDEAVFAQDLAPYILHGRSLKSDGALCPPPRDTPPPLEEEASPPKLDSSFAIDSLLHSLHPPTTEAGEERLRNRLPPVLSRYPYTHRASISSASPGSSSSDEDSRSRSCLGKHGREAGPGVDEDSQSSAHKFSRGDSGPPWELPTSYAKYAPPNVIAPPSMFFSRSPFLPFRRLPYYGYHAPPATPSHFVNHSYWALPTRGSTPLQTPPLYLDLDRLLQSVPPNKSVFDVMGASNPLPHSQPGQYSLQTPYSHY
ncbi:forkhead box protein H1 [Scleropages formosus]|nr:forkhead box protein H1 [Scleropages formosus]